MGFKTYVFGVPGGLLGSSTVGTGATPPNRWTPLGASFPLSFPIVRHRGVSPPLTSVIPQIRPSCRPHPPSLGFTRFPLVVAGSPLSCRSQSTRLLRPRWLSRALVDRKDGQGEIEITSHRRPYRAPGHIPVPQCHRPEVRDSVGRSFETELGFRARRRWTARLGPGASPFVSEVPVPLRGVPHAGKIGRPARPETPDAAEVGVESPVVTITTVIVDTAWSTVEEGSPDA